MESYPEPIDGPVPIPPAHGLIVPGVALLPVTEKPCNPEPPTPK